MTKTPRLVLFYDTETSGLGDFKLPYDDPIQPNLLQLGYRIENLQTRQVIMEAGFLVDTTSFPSWNGIHPDAQAVHKITEESVKEFGISPHSAFKALQKWVDLCDIAVAHNDGFDTKVLQCFAKRADFSPEIFKSHHIKICTMMKSINIAKIPYPSGKAGYKWPKLIEAYKALINPEGFPDAHNALADVNACRDIFWYLVDKNVLMIPGVNYALPTNSSN